MDNNLMIFESPEFGTIRSMIVDGNPWFMGKDVAKALGYANTSKAIGDHCHPDGVTFRYPIDNLGRPQKAKYITEGNVYRLIAHSKLPAAVQFERWVFDEVIPSIRKHGAYVTDAVLDQIKEHPELVSDLIQTLKAENAEARKNRELLEQARVENARLAPKAGYYDTFVGVDDLTCLRYTAKELGVPQNKFIGYLLEKGYAFRDRHRDDRIFARACKRNDPLFMTKDFYLPNGDKSEYTLVTPAGKEHFRKLVDKIRDWEPGIADGEQLTENAVFAS